MKEIREYLKRELEVRYSKKTIVNDGILVPEIYNRQDKKVLFLLKETFGDYNLIQGPQEIYNGKSSPFWPNIFNWTNLVNISESKYYEKWEIKEITNFINAIAYVNVKKINENRKKSNHKDILAYANADSDLLKCQIDNINPDVIYTSNTTMQSYRIIYGDQDINLIKAVSCGRQVFELHMHKNRKIIKTFHPSAYPIKGRFAFETIKKLIK